MNTAPEEVKSKLDIVEIVGEYLQLTKGGGQSMKGLCPFHTEKTPSFYVHRDRQFFHCFGCGESGDLFTFYQKIENLEFPDALRELAERAGVELPSYDPKAKSERGELLAVLEDAARFFEACLKHEIGERARNYLKERGLKDVTVGEFRVGYAPGSWEALVTALGKKGHTMKRIVEAGMAIESERGRKPYDRFRDRVMIPITDEKGHVIGFTGRIMPDNPEADRTGKYINTPETPVYKKRKVVFALDKARDHIKAADFAVLVEGQMDVISSHEAGVKNVVAVSGTALTEDQIDLIKRFSKRLALAFDADVAGQNAMAKSLPHAWGVGMQVLVVTLPDGFKDPDEVIRADATKWEDAITHAEDMVAYSVDRALASVEANDPFSKKKAISELKPIFALLRDDVLHAHWVHTVAERLGLPDEAVRKDLRGMPSKKASGNDSGSKQVREPDRPSSREEKLTQRLISLILNHPDRYLSKLKELDVRWIPDGYLLELAKKLKASYTDSDHDLLTQKEVFSWFEEVRRDHQEMPPIHAFVLLKERDMAGWTEEALTQEFDACLTQLEISALKRQKKELVAAIAEAEAAGDSERAARLAGRLEELTKTHA